MIKRGEFVKLYSEIHDIDLQTSKAETDRVWDVLSIILHEDEDDIYISKVGSFKRKTLKSKRNKNPITGEYQMTDPKDVVRFYLSEAY